MLLARIIGIDPGLATTGWAIIDSDIPGSLIYGKFTTEAKNIQPHRLYAIEVELKRILDEFNPRYAAMESLAFGGRSARLHQTAEALGVIRLTLWKAGLMPHVYSPTAVKKKIAGKGRASKRDVIEAIIKEWGYPQISKIKSDHITDAIAIALMLEGAQFASRKNYILPVRRS